MPRQGRQPAQLNQQPKKSKNKQQGGNHKQVAALVAKATPAAGASRGKKTVKQSAASDDGGEEDGDAALDVYNYSARVKRPRGDVDPLARASFGSSSKKGKGKARAPRQDEGDDEELSDEVSGSDDDEDGAKIGGGFRVRGNEVVEFMGMKPAGFKLGMDSGDEGGFIGSDDDDEEIDSDLAEDSDEEEDLPRLRAGGGSQARDKKGKGRQAEIDLDEDEIDYDDEEGEGWMDLADVLDAGGYGTADSDSGEGSSDADKDEEDESMTSEEEDSDEEGFDPEALEKLDSFVFGLDSKKRKSRGDGDDADEDGAENASKKKRSVLKERTEAYPEGEFTAVKPMEGTSDGKIDLDDLLSSFTDSKNPRLASLRKSLKPLAPTSSSSSANSTAKVTTTNSHLKAAGPLAAPLPGRLQDKVDREAAYEATKAETDKWNETVRRMKGESGLGAEGARHERLVLPLMGGEGDVHREANANELSAKFQPTNELEASIQNLLTTAQMSQSDLQKQEQAALATLDPADLAARQAELRRQRDLMYRAERKAKRVAKIKSKAYRRIHRKAKEREAAGEGPQMTLEDLAELDAIDGGNRAEEERARLEIQRAKERATLKHSGKGGRWAKKIDGLEGLEEERNASIRDMVARREELRKKIAGIEDGDDEVDEFASDSEGGSDSDNDAAGHDVDAIRRRAFDELAALDAKEAAAKASDPKLKGVLNMKFMRDAMARADKQVASEAEELRQRLAQMDEAGRIVDDEEEEGDALAPMALSEQVQGNLGRMVFGPSGSAAAQATAESVPVPTLSNSAATTTKMSAPVSISNPSASRARPRPSLSNPLASAADESNPWLTLGTDESSGKLSRKMNKLGDVSSAAAKTAAKADRARAKQADARAAERDDATVEIDLDAAAGLAAERRKKAKGRKGEDAPQVGKALASIADDDESGDSDAELDEDEINAQRGKGPTAFRQRELVKEAFANDDVVADFADEKRKEIERDAPREEDITLPGWGAWAGKGAKKAKNARKFVKKIDGVDASQRKDAKLNHVIISERKDKKAAKYMLKDLPFPYTSAAQHEHKLRTPMGPEWSTSTILRDQTIPAVLVKPGVTIRPVDRKAA